MQKYEVTVSRNVSMTFYVEGENEVFIKNFFMNDEALHGISFLGNVRYDTYPNVFVSEASHLGDEEIAFRIIDEVH